MAECNDESNCGDSLLQEIVTLIGNVEPRTIDERRVRQRFPMFCTLRLIPIDQAGTVLVDEESVIVGKDLSVRGISFSHDHPLLYRRAVISFSHPQSGQFSVEAEINWTRLMLSGLYESGCRLIRKLPGHSISLLA